MGVTRFTGWVSDHMQPHAAGWEVLTRRGCWIMKAIECIPLGWQREFSAD
jgi:hypothetical protein